MPSFLGKLRSGTTGSSTTTSAPNKKDGKELLQTWLTKLAQDREPVQIDGSDKFYGAENFGNTCYFNSMVQSLYYSVPFRDMVLAYPQRSPAELVLNDAEGKPRKNIRDIAQVNGQLIAASAKKATAGPASTRSAGTTSTPQKPEDKESPEYKKKQAMLNGPVLDVNYDNSSAYGMPESLFTCLKDSFEALIANKSRTGVLSMSRFLEKLRQENEMFRSPMHQDAHEFFNFLLNGVIDSVEDHTKTLEKDGPVAENGAAKEPGRVTVEKSKAAHAEFQKLFQGQLTSETKCLTCENVSKRDEPFLDLSVDIENHSSVTSCLRQFSEEEMLCERDKFFCDMCGGLQEAEKRMKVKRLPKVLTLHLKRFKYTEDLQRLQKLFHRVVYPYHLRLFNTTDDAEDPDKLYELYAVVVHIGSGPYHGHYVSIIKTPDRGWLLFDDEMVEPVDKSFARNFFGAQIGMACAYVLFYQETTLEAVKKEQEAEGLAAAAAAAAAEVQQPPLPNDQETQSLNLPLKVNGISGTPTSPMAKIPHEDELPLLTHVATAPAATASPRSPLLPNTVPAIHSLTPTHGQLPQLAKAETKDAKKQAAKEEKERKAAEKKADKAREKEEKERRKSHESRGKAQAAALLSTLQAGKPPPHANGTSTAPTAQSSSTTAPPPPPSAAAITAAATATTSMTAAEASSPTASSAQSPAHHYAASFSATSPTTASGGWNKSSFSLMHRHSSKSGSRKSKFWPSLSSPDGKSGSALAVPAPTSNPAAAAAAAAPSPTAHAAAVAAHQNDSSNNNKADDVAVEEDSGPDVPEKDFRPKVPAKDLPKPAAPIVRQPSTSAVLGARGAVLSSSAGTAGAGNKAPAAATGAAAGVQETQAARQAASATSAEVTAPPQPPQPKKRGLSMIRKKASNLMS